jgi:hypothetical protein
LYVEGYPTLKAEKGEQSNVLGALFTLCQFGEDEESLPPSAASHPDTLETRCQAVEEAFGDTPPTHDGHSAKVLEGEVGEGEKNADGKDPF